MRKNQRTSLVVSLLVVTLLVQSPTLALAGSGGSSGGGSDGDGATTRSNGFLGTNYSSFGDMFDGG